MKLQFGDFIEVVSGAERWKRLTARIAGRRLRSTSDFGLQ
jgi:hypothetical protein